MIDEDEEVDRQEANSQYTKGEESQHHEANRYIMTTNDQKGPSTLLVIHAIDIACERFHALRYRALGIGRVPLLLFPERAATAALRKCSTTRRLVQ